MPAPQVRCTEWIILGLEENDRVIDHGSERILDHCARRQQATRSCHGLRPYSTVTDLARLRGWSTSVPMITAV